MHMRAHLTASTSVLSIEAMAHMVFGERRFLRSLVVIPLNNILYFYLNKDETCAIFL
jgi:hypothetical protein